MTECRNAQSTSMARITTTLADLQTIANWNRTVGGITLSDEDFSTQMIILPVELISFDAYQKENNILLNWSTASEINNEYFEVHHSIDGTNFRKIQQVSGVGNSIQVNHYALTHKNPTNGINYYRLKQVDYDGKFEYSDIISVDFRGEDDQVVSVFPNPFTESITLKIPSSERNNSYNNRHSIKIYDSNNRLIQSNKFPNDQDTIQLDLSDLSEGIYFVSIDLGNDNYHIVRVLKQAP